MKYLIYILAISSICLTQEMEVQGDLKVTGTVQSTTIDSLKAVIGDLQAQLAALQGAGVWESRVFEYNNYEINFNSPPLTINDITGYDLEYSMLDIIDINPINIGDYNGNIWNIKNNERYSGTSFFIYSHDNKITYPYRIIYNSENTDHLEFQLEGYVSGNGSPPFFINLKFLVTAEFPSESNTLIHKKSGLTKVKN